MKPRITLLLLVLVVSTLCLAKEKPSPEKVAPKDLVPQPSLSLNELEITKIQLVIEKLGHADDNTKSLRFQAQLLHDQICVDHNISPKDCSFTPDYSSIVQRATTNNTPAKK